MVGQKTLVLVAAEEGSLSQKVAAGKKDEEPDADEQTYVAGVPMPLALRACTTVRTRGGAQLVGYVCAYLMFSAAGCDSLGLTLLRLGVDKKWFYWGSCVRVPCVSFATPACHMRCPPQPQICQVWWQHHRQRNPVCGLLNSSSILFASNKMFFYS